MAKKKDKMSGEAFDVAGFMSAAMSAARSSLGEDRVYVAAEHTSKQTGFTLPTFALKYLINNTAWPLQRVTSCGGPPKGRKSSFAYQLQRWVLDAGGIVSHIETENKATTGVMRSILGAEYMSEDGKMTDRLAFYNTGTVNAWQRVIHGQVDLLKKFAEASGRRPELPIMWNIDTLMGATTEEGLAKASETGETQGRGYSDAPILISQFLRETPDILLGWPVFLHLTHQEKDAMGHPGKVRAGGLAPEFYTSLDLQFKVGGASAWSKTDAFHRPTSGVYGTNITMKVRKSSIGPDRDRQIVVPFITQTHETVDPATGAAVRSQTHKWDWNAATADLLATTLARDVKPLLAIDSEITSKGSKVYWCDAVGVTAASPVSGPEMGALLEGSRELMVALEDLLFITRIEHVMGTVPALVV